MRKQTVDGQFVFKLRGLPLLAGGKLTLYGQKGRMRSYGILVGPVVLGIVVGR